MDNIRIYKNCWEAAVIHKYEDAMRSLEMTIQEVLNRDYDVSLVEFDRDNKEVKFQFQLEEITI